MSSWVLVGTLPGGPGGVANVLARQTVGVSQSVVADLGRFSQIVGVDVDVAPIRATSQQTVGVSQDDIVSGTAKSQQTVGVVLTSKAEGGGVGGQSPQTVGAEIKQMRVDLLQTTYALTAGSAGTWQNPNNALNAPNGTFATNSNSVTTAASNNLVLTFANQVNKTELTIDSVILDVYWKNVAGLVGPVNYVLEYSFDNVNWFGLANNNVSFDKTSEANRDSYGLTSDVGQDWSKLSNLRVRFRYNGAASATPSTLSVDAVRLKVSAHRYDDV